MFAAALAKKRSAALLQITRSVSRQRCDCENLPPCAHRSGNSNYPRCNPPEDEMCKRPMSPLTGMKCECGHLPPCMPRTGNSKVPKCDPLINESECQHGAMQCCNKPYPNDVLRLDDVFYKRSDKAKRRYQQTWVACREPVKKTKVYCCFDETAEIPIEKRPRCQRPLTATNCKMQREQDCTLAKNAKCLRIVLPGCRSRRTTFHCLVEPNPGKGCPNRDLPPYPSFSECCRPRPEPAPKTECNCVWDPLQCEINKEFEKWLWTKMKQNY